MITRKNSNKETSDKSITPNYKTILAILTISNIYTFIWYTVHIFYTFTYHRLFILLLSAHKKTSTNHDW